MKNTYLDLLPVDILEIIYTFVSKLNYQDVLTELIYSLKNDNNLSNKYLQTYNELLTKIENPYYLKYNPSYMNTYFSSIYFNKWLYKNYLNEGGIFKSNIIHDSHTINLIHTCNLLYTLRDVDSTKKFKETLYRLEYYDLVSLKNFIKP